MKARLFRLSADTWDIRTSQPDDPLCFNEKLTAVIGPADFEGGDYFHIDVCTPRWIQQHHCGLAWGRFMLIVDKYDYEEIAGFVSRYVESCEGENWEELAAKLSRVMFWEFEDYQFEDAT